MSLRFAIFMAAFGVMGALASPGDETYGLTPSVKFVPRGQYELEYLGLLGDKNDENDQGVFQLIWKGKKETILDGFLIAKPQTFEPNSRFSYHYQTGWELVPELPRCGFGMSLPANHPTLTIQPKCPTKLIVDMLSLKLDSQKSSVIRPVHRVAILIFTREGTLVSREFPLPFTLRKAN